jgi:ribosomal protein S18 acetylase RimI-like enzyme
MDDLVADALARWRSGGFDGIECGVRCASSAVFERLVAAFRDETDASVRAAIVWCVGQRRSDAHAAFFASALRDPDRSVWQEALDGLVGLSSADARAALVVARDGATDSERRAWIEEALEQITVVLRNAGTEDAGKIAILHVASWKDVYRGLLPEAFLQRLSAAERGEDWRRRLEARDGIVRLAEEAGALVGFCASGPSPDTGASAVRAFEIRNLHVSPSRRGGGIGSRLFEDAVGIARSHDAREITLWVAEGNAGAQRFYRRQGMSADGARQADVVGPEAVLDEVRFRMRLD